MLRICAGLPAAAGLCALSRARPRHSFSRYSPEKEWSEQRGEPEVAIADRRLPGERPKHIHDLRHSFASVGVGGSLGLPLIGKLFGTFPGQRTTQRYAHLDAAPLHKAANLIGSQISAALGSRSR